MSLSYYSVVSIFSSGSGAAVSGSGSGSGGRVELIELIIFENCEAISVVITRFVVLSVGGESISFIILRIV